jgi:hypothetical protein
MKSKISRRRGYAPAPINTDNDIHPTTPIGLRGTGHEKHEETIFITKHHIQREDAKSRRKTSPPAALNATRK